MGASQSYLYIDGDDQLNTFYKKEIGLKITKLKKIVLEKLYHNRDLSIFCFLSGMGCRVNVALSDIGSPKKIQKKFWKYEREIVNNLEDFLNSRDYIQDILKSEKLTVNSIIINGQFLNCILEITPFKEQYDELKSYRDMGRMLSKREHDQKDDYEDAIYRRVLEYAENIFQPYVDKIFVQLKVKLQYGDNVMLSHHSKNENPNNVIDRHAQIIIKSLPFLQDIFKVLLLEKFSESYYKLSFDNDSPFRLNDEYSPFGQLTFFCKVRLS